MWPFRRATHRACRLWWGSAIREIDGDGKSVAARCRLSVFPAQSNQSHGCEGVPTAVGKDARSQTLMNVLPSGAIAQRLSPLEQAFLPWEGRNLFRRGPDYLSCLSGLAVHFDSRQSGELSVSQCRHQFL